MGIGKRRFDRHIKSLMHFDYPYFEEPGDGMRDEIGVLSWSAEGNAIFVGTEVPIAPSNTETEGTPKFGWRCLQTSADTDYITAAVTSPYLDIDASKVWEYEMFVRKTSSSAGNILVLFNGQDAEVLSIETDSSDKILVTSTVMNINAESTSGLTLNMWEHLKVRINEGTLTVLISGVQVYTGAVSGTAENIASIRLGGFPGQIDEFMIQNKLDTSSVPVEPHRGIMEMYGIGGDGHNGELNLQTGTNYINTCYVISTIHDTSSFTVNSLTQQTNSVGIHGQAAIGDELMIYKNQKVDGNLEPSDSGCYVFKKIRSVSTTTFTLEEPITEFAFTQDELTNYNIEAILVPNYTRVVIGSDATCAVTGSTAYGGVCVFRSRGDVTVEGKILTTMVKSWSRHDYFQMTHYHCPERIPKTCAGVAIILSEGTVTAGDDARIGNSWSGAGTWGAGAAKGGYAGGNAGSGYGGGGASYPYSNTSYRGKGGGGGVGYGGQQNYYVNTPGKDGGRPGAWKARDNGTSNGWHTQGEGVQVSMPCWGSDTMFNGASRLKGRGGASVIIICRRINLSMDAVSTGGEGGSYNTNAQGAVQRGSGTGMCYLAYEEAV